MRCPILKAHAVGTRALRLKIIRTEKSYAQKILRTEKSYAQKSHTHKLEAQRYNKEEIIHIELLHAQNNPVVIMM